MKRYARFVLMRNGICASLALLLMLAVAASAETPAPAVKQRTFSSPQAAVQALVKATRDNDTKALLALFGPGSESLISSGDETADRRDREQFGVIYAEKHRIERKGPKAVLYIGKDDWPLPFPIVRKAKNVWQFDTSAGKDEILSRRIGENELSAIQVIQAIGDAEREYAERVRQQSGQPEYSSRLESEKGAKNGLYWESTEGETASPLGPMVARARGEGYADKQEFPDPYHGYLYRILTSQSENAGGGAYPYIVNGKMIGGFAVVAYPAVYGTSGVQTFIMNHEGKIFKKDLGPETMKIAGSMTIFDPDSTWTPVK